MRRHFFLLASVVLLMFAPLGVHAAVTSGDLIKLADDGNPQTQHDTAVYYVGADSKRYVFPNSKTYFTWYANFDSVKIVSSSEMASLQIGGNVTYRPGTRLVKIQSDPKVYAVEPGGSLRPIASEEVARTLYGTDWNKRVDDVADTYFINYTIGSQLAAAVYPTGSVIRTTSGSLYYIEGGSKRLITSDAVRSALRIQDAFVISVSDTLATYPDGTSLAAAETALTDTSGRNAVAETTPPTFTVRTPASTYIGIGSDAVLMEISVKSGTPVTVTRLDVQIDSLIGFVSTDTDTDLGGLVYGNNAQRNLDPVRFVDASGGEPFGRRQIALDATRDQSQTLSFTGSLYLAAGQEKTLYLKAQVNKMVSAGEIYRATLLKAGTSVVGSSGTSVSFLPASDLQGTALTTLSDSLEVAPAPSFGNKTYVRGTAKAPVTGISFKATTHAPNVIKSITFQGYIDEGENGGGFLAGSDSDNGTSTSVRDVLTAAYLMDDKGNQLAGPVTVDTSGRASFSGLSISIPAGGNQTLVVYGDISSTIDLESNPNKITFDIDDASADVVVQDNSGGTVAASGIKPNGGYSPASWLTVRRNGSVEFEWTGQSSPELAGTEALFGTFKATPSYDDFTLKTFALTNVGTSSSSLGNIRLEYLDSAGATKSVAASVVGGSVTFSNVSIPLPDGKTTQLNIYGKLLPRDGGAVYGEHLKLQFASSGPFTFISSRSGEIFSETNLGSSDFKLKTNGSSDITVRYSKLSVSVASGSPQGSVYRDTSAEVLRFSFRADSAGAVRLKRMTSKIVSDDSGTTGSDSDLLERWADVNGDFNDDDGIVNLKRLVTGGDSTLIGEGPGSSIKYYISTDDTPAGRDTTQSDYGLIRYEFGDGNEYSLAAGGELVLSLELKLDDMATDKNHLLGVRMLTDDNFLWTDIPSGSYTPMSGANVMGIDFGSNLTVVM